MSIRLEIGAVKAGGRLLIKPSSVTLVENMIYVISSPSGTGKSLLLNRIFDSLYGIRDRVLVCQDNNALLDEKTAAENIRLDYAAGRAGDNGFGNAFDNASSNGFGNTSGNGFGNDFGNTFGNISGNTFGGTGSKESVSGVGVNTYVNAGVLSGGQKRFVCVERGFNWCPPGGVLLLDEPTNDLDPAGVVLLEKKIENFSRHHTIIIVSHDDRIIRLADHVLEIRDGALVDTSHSAGAQGADFEENHMVRNLLPAKTSSEPFNRSFYTSLLRGRTVPRAALAALALIAVLFSQALLLPDMQHYPSIRSNEVYIFVPNSVMGSEYLLSGAVPISALSLITDNNSLYSRIDAFQDIVDTHRYDQLTYLPKIRSSSTFSPQVREYYDTSSSAFIDSTDAGPASKKNLLISFYTLRIRGKKSFRDLINDPTLRQLSELNYYVASTETVDFIRQINSFSQKESALASEVALGSCTLLIFLTAMLLIMIGNSGQFYIYKNVGICWSTQFKWVIRTIDRKPDFIVTVCAVTLAVLMLQIFSGVPPAAGNFSAVFILIFFLICMSAGSRLWAWIVTKKVYSWRYR